MNSGEDLDELESIEQRVSSHAIDWGDKQRVYYDGYDGKKQMHRRRDDDDEDDPTGRRRGARPGSRVGSVNTGRNAKHDGTFSTGTMAPQHRTTDKTEGHHEHIF